MSDPNVQITPAGGEKSKGREFTHNRVFDGKIPPEGPATMNQHSAEPTPAAPSIAPENAKPEGITGAEGEATPPESAGGPNDGDKMFAEPEPPKHVPPAEPKKSAATASPQETKPIPAPNKKYRFRGHDEAEKGYKDLQGEKTRVEQENAMLRKELDQIHTEKVQAEQKRQQEEFISTTYKETVEAISQLDPDSPTYTTETANLWAKAHQDINNFVPKIDDVKPASELFKPVEPATEEPATEEPTGGISDEAINEVQNVISERFKHHEVNFDNQDPIFSYFAQRSPAFTEGTNEYIPLEQQVDWAIDQTQKHYQALKTKILQEVGQPMGRNGEGVPKPGTGNKSPQQKLTLGGAIERARAKRTLQ